MFTPATMPDSMHGSISQNENRDDHTNASGTIGSAYSVAAVTSVRRVSVVSVSPRHLVHAALLAWPNTRPSANEAATTSAASLDGAPASSWNQSIMYTPIKSIGSVQKGACRKRATLTPLLKICGALWRKLAFLTGVRLTDLEYMGLADRV